MTPLLEIAGLRKAFGERRLLDIPRFAILPGAAYVLTGPNGAGKSTLLRILSGLEPADAGEARFLGQPVALRPYPRALRDAIGYVHQHPVMFSTSLAANVGFGLAARDVAKPDIARRVDAALDWAGIGHLRKASPLSLSGGEKQRVALARAKVLGPKLLLLDEPTASLDERARGQVVALIAELVAGGASVVAACHDRDLIGAPGMRHLPLESLQAPAGCCLSDAENAFIQTQAGMRHAAVTAGR